jgi:hypothetical protein
MPRWQELAVTGCFTNAQSHDPQIPLRIDRPGRRERGGQQADLFVSVRKCGRRVVERNQATLEYPLIRGFPFERIGLVLLGQVVPIGKAFHFPKMVAFP